MVNIWPNIFIHWWILWHTIQNITKKAWLNSFGYTVLLQRDIYYHICPSGVLENTRHFVHLNGILHHFKVHILQQRANATSTLADIQIQKELWGLPFIITLLLFFFFLPFKGIFCLFFDNFIHEYTVSGSSLPKTPSHINFILFFKTYWSTYAKHHLLCIAPSYEPPPNSL